MSRSAVDGTSSLRIAATVLLVTLWSENTTNASVNQTASAFASSIRSSAFGLMRMTEQNPPTAATQRDGGWQSNAEPRDDVGTPAPGAIEPPLEVIERDPDNWLNLPPDEEWLNVIRDPLRDLEAKTGLSITGAYTILFQQSIGPDAHSAGAGDFDLYARWTVFGRGTADTGSFYMATEFRHDIGSIPPSDLGGEIGTLLGTTDGFSDRGWAIKDLYFAQRLFDDHLRLGLGRVNPDVLVANHALQSANTSFLNRAFSANPTISFPGSGLGAAASVRPTDWLYVAGGATNAYGNTTTSEIDTLFDEWRLFKFIEVGVTPTIDNWGEGKYRIAFWHMDSRSLDDRPSDGGFTILFDQDFGEQITAFVRYGLADGDLTGVEHSAQVGGAYKGLFGSEEDLTGLAFGWSSPMADLRDEKVVEVFHRMQLTGRTQFTLGAQIIFDPSNAPEVDTLGVLSARMRVSF